MSVVAELISQDFNLKRTGRWGKTLEHDSLVVDYEKDIFFWNSRNLAGDAMVYLMKVRGMNFHDAREYLRKFEKYKDTFVYTADNQKQDVVVYPKLVETFWENGLNQRDYWYYRGLNDEAIDRFRLGFYEGWYLIPVFVDGTFRNFQKRRDDPKKQISPWYRGVGPLLFNSDILKLTNKILITEGPVDAILLNQLGIPAVSHTAGAEGFQQEWFKYFIYQKEIIYVADNDKVGIQAGLKVGKILGEMRTKVLTFRGYPDKYDAVDFFRDGGTKDDFLKLMEAESKYVFELLEYKDSRRRPKDI